ncbi:MAG: T9SS type A sorting domain-containing protein [Chitinophagaceae bacterium]
MKTFVLSAAVLFVVLTSKAQSFSENFNSSTVSSLTSSCWVLNGTTTSNQNGEVIEGTSLYTAPAPNNNVKVDLYTPILNVASTNTTVSFDYQLTQALGANALRMIQVGLVNPAGNLVILNSITMDANTPASVLQYVHTFSAIAPGYYRVVLRISGSNGNGNIRIILDNVVVNGASLYSTGSCDFNPIVEGTLPVKLTSFTAQLNNSKVDLKWVTSTEINASHFVIERSYNGTDFTDIATVMAAGNSTTEKIYSYSDNTVSSLYQVAYYRLRQVDIDSKADYSSTRIIRTGKQDQTAISILSFPNPVSNELRVTIPNNWQGKKATYEVVNVSGQVAKKIETGNSSQTETINVSNMAPGFYIVRVTCDGQTAQQKIVKQ